MVVNWLIPHIFSNITENSTAHPNYFGFDLVVDHAGVGQFWIYFLENVQFQLLQLVLLLFSACLLLDLEVLLVDHVDLLHFEVVVHIFAIQAGCDRTAFIIGVVFELVRYFYWFVVLLLFGYDVFLNLCWAQSFDQMGRIIRILRRDDVLWSLHVLSGLDRWWFYVGVDVLLCACFHKRWWSKCCFACLQLWRVLFGFACICHLVGTLSYYR